MFLIFPSRHLSSDKLCSKVSLPAAKKSEIHPIFGKTISFLVKAEKQVIVTLHEKPKEDSARYSFTIGKGALTSELYRTGVLKESANTANVFNANQWRTIWIDFRSSNLVLGSGGEVLLQWIDPSPFSVSYVSFTADPTTETRILLCNKQSESRSILSFNLFLYIPRVFAEN